MDVSKQNVQMTVAAMWLYALYFSYDTVASVLAFALGALSYHDVMRAYVWVRVKLWMAQQSLTPKQTPSDTCAKRCPMLKPDE